MSRTKTAGARTARARASQPAFRILLATSGDEASLGAISLAAALAGKRHAEVEVLTVVVPFPHSSPTAFGVMPPAIIDQDSRQRALERVKEQLARIRGTGEWPIVAEVGWAPDVVALAAERWEASLIVVGLGEHHLLDRLFGSETAVKLAHHSSVPVIAVPQHHFGLPGKAVVAIDFTAASERAATAAADVLDSDGTITLLHASTLIKLSSRAGTLTDVYTAGARSKIEALRDALRARTKCNVETALVPESVIDTLLGMADRHECDLVALGSQELGLIDRLLFGSVRSKVLRHADVPVLIAPATARARQQ
jgi:nucleotide-binding universal stress UspA family protein